MEAERKAFLKAIKKEPENYLHRYVYADWLDERGEHDEADRQRKFEKSDKWLRNFAEETYTDYDGLVEGAASGEGYFFGDTDGPERMAESEVWEHLEVVTGKKFSEEHRENTPFSCAC